MLRLDLTRAAKWRDLGHGVQLLCDPVTTGVLAEARRDPAVQGLLPEAGDDGTPAPIVGEVRDALAQAMALAVATRVVREWDGVGDQDGKPLPLSADGLAALLDLGPIYDAFQAHILAPAMLLVSEKNGSAPLPPGISAGVETTAAPVPGAAKNARARSTTLKRPRA
jgi:hypothetical protein